MALTRETKLGLVVAGSFVCLLGALVARKMLQPKVPGGAPHGEQVAKGTVAAPTKTNARPTTGSEGSTTPSGGPATTSTRGSDIQLATLQTPAPRPLPEAVTTSGNRTEPTSTIPVPASSGPASGKGSTLPIIPAPTSTSTPETQASNVPLPGKPAGDEQLKLLEEQKRLMLQREQEAAAAPTLLTGQSNPDHPPVQVAQGPQPPQPGSGGTTSATSEVPVPLPPAAPAPAPAIPPPTPVPLPASETNPAVPAPLPQGATAPAVPPPSTTLAPGPTSVPPVPPAPVVPAGPTDQAANTTPSPAPVPPGAGNTTSAPVPPAPATPPVPPPGPAPTNNRNAVTPVPAPSAPPAVPAPAPERGNGNSSGVNLTPPVPMPTGQNQTQQNSTGQAPPVVPMGTPANDVVPRNQGIVVPPVPTMTSEPAATEARNDPRPLPAVGTAPIPVPQPMGQRGTPVVKDYTLNTYSCEAGVTSFEQISSKFYYSPRYGRALLLFNRKLPSASAALRQDPPHLAPGERIMIPPAYILEQMYPSEIGQPSTTGIVPASNSPPSPAPTTPAPVGATRGTVPAVPQTGNTHTVRPGGELLYEIARERLGDGRRWVEIYRLNPTLSVEGEGRIPAGTQLKLPTASRVTP